MVLALEEGLSVFSRWPPCRTTHNPKVGMPQSWWSKKQNQATDPHGGLFLEATYHPFLCDPGWGEGRRALHIAVAIRARGYGSFGPSPKLPSTDPKAFGGKLEIMLSRLWSSCNRKWLSLEQREPTDMKSVRVFIPSFIPSVSSSSQLRSVLFEMQIRAAEVLPLMCLGPAGVVTLEPVTTLKLIITAL